jgi:hypothetical protein
VRCVEAISAYLHIFMNLLNVNSVPDTATFSVNTGPGGTAAAMAHLEPGPIGGQEHRY